MSLADLKTELGLDAESALERFAGHEAIYVKYLKRFCAEKNAQAFLNEDLLADKERLLIVAHTLKGIAANLGLTRLSTAYSFLVNALREQRADMIPIFYEDAKTLQRAAAESIVRNLDGV